tara:strand:- start:100 stop:489 length:390 start_codon:yes stop_codon:yes gene_type:complete
MKKVSSLLILIFIGFGLIISACEKNEINKEDNNCCDSDNASQMRMAMKEEGYIEVESIPVEKINCYFGEWDKTILTPVSGLLEYYNQNNDWVASINFGDGNCDQWGTKTWDTNIFPEYSEGILEFLLFE